MKGGVQAKRTSVNLDQKIAEDAKLALWEAQRAGIKDCPKSLMALYAQALRRETEELRKKARKASGQTVRGVP